MAGYATEGCRVRRVDREGKRERETINQGAAKDERGKRYLAREKERETGCGACAATGYISETYNSTNDFGAGN